MSIQTETISQEVKPEWNIKFTCIEPGGVSLYRFALDPPYLHALQFRTDWAGRSMEFGSIEHPEYDHLNAKKDMGERNGTQAGDPPKAAEAMYKLATMSDPPLRVVLGSDAYKAIMGKIETYQENYKK